MSYPTPERSFLAELTRYEIEKAGADIQSYTAVVPFTLSSGHRAYIPLSALKYYNPRVDVAPGDIRYLDPEFFEARIKDKADHLPKEKSVAKSSKTPAYGPYAWIKVPVSGGNAYGLDGVEMAKFMMLATTTDNDLMIAADLHPDDVIEYLAKTFGKTRTTILAMIRTFKAKGILYENVRGELLFSEGFIIRGKITKAMQNCAVKAGYRWMRMYFSAITQLYRDEKLTLALRYLGSMLPYLHNDYNVFCMRPDHNDPFLVAPLSGRQLAAAGGYSRSNYTELTNICLNGTIRTSKGIEAVMVRLNEPFEGIPKGSILLNPRIFYIGDGDTAYRLERMCLRRPRGHYKKRRKGGAA